MAAFANPYVGNTPTGKMSTSDLVRALRMDLAAEEEAAFLYTAHIDATDNELAKKTLRDIANEEILHAGELHRLIEILSPEEKTHFDQGKQEVENLARQVAAIMEA